MKSLTKAMIATLVMALSLPALAGDRDDRGSRDGESSKHHERERDRDGRRAERATQAGWLSRDEISRKLATGGLKAERIKAGHSHYEVSATDASGARMKVHVDATSGEIIRRERGDRR